MERQKRLETAILIAIVLLVAIWVRHSYIPTFHDRHIEVSEQKYNFDVGEPGAWFSAWSLGDGQAYVLIALEPSGQKLDQEIDESGYRFARAGYGWATALAALGQPNLIPYALAVVGVLSLAGLIGVTTRLATSIGRRAWLILVNPAVYIGLGGDTSEPLGVLFLTLAFASTGWISAVLLGLTRPTYLVGLWGRWRQFVPGALAAMGLAVYSLTVFGADALAPDGGRLGLPLTAYFEHKSLAGWTLALLAAITATVGLKSRDWAWALAGLLVLCFGSDVLRDPVNAWRAAGFLPVLWAFGPGYRIAVSAPSTTEILSSG